MGKRRIVFYMCVCCILVFNQSFAQLQSSSFPTVYFQKKEGAFPLISNKTEAPLLISPAEAAVVTISAKAFKKDLQLKGAGEDNSFRYLTAEKQLPKIAIIAASLGASPLADSLFSATGIDIGVLKRQSESFVISIKSDKSGAQQKLLIAGSDPRGTAYGLFELSRRIGVSPWHWWADVKPQVSSDVFIGEGTFMSESPSVAYRGIFINDEDWGLRPWAANTDTLVNNIGPATYAKVFELLLRLKANLIWPAMHEGTKGFFEFPENVKLAEDYSIIIGSSHAEPMLRNNVAEWNTPSFGSFNYKTNRAQVYNYWKSRVIEARNLSGIYNLGMRGVHDSGMQGVKSPTEAATLLSQVIDDQRNILREHVNADITKIPQAFPIYKEVLDIYETGLKVPEDVTLIWPDDNYGYIQRLSDSTERHRSGGAGVYYHASYWGRPHDYLWLSTTHPLLLQQQMLKAYQHEARKIWVLNVGDIKPGEYTMQFFLDMAYDIRPFYSDVYARQHLKNWVSENLPGGATDQLSNTLWKYYDLAFERKPEFMGWSQTEPTRPTTFTAYQHFAYGDEAMKRVDQYMDLEAQVKSLWKDPQYRKSDPFFQLVYYPVVCASLMNKKFLYRDKAWLYAAQGRTSALTYAAMSDSAYTSIVRATKYYNDTLAGGKWKGMMSMKPRSLPVFEKLDFRNLKLAEQPQPWGVVTEGHSTDSDSTLYFDDASADDKFVDVFLKGNVTQTKDFRIALKGAFAISKERFRLGKVNGDSEIRLRVRPEWRKIKKNDHQGVLSIQAGGFRRDIPLVASRNAGQYGHPGIAAEARSYVSIHASNYSRLHGSPVSAWIKVSGIAYTAFAMRSTHPASRIPAPDVETQACMEYDFLIHENADTPELYFYCLPGHPAGKNQKRGLAFSIDGGPVQQLDMTTLGRSEQWKQHVLRNAVEVKASITALAKGKHILKIYAIADDLSLDRIFIKTRGKMAPPYAAIAETRL